jgi:hypothetical protein
MASAIFYIASAESSFTTGIDLVADGGLQRNATCAVKPK